jgi:predicted RNA binding protein YcfA (HicA-like mRNA interferase family)
VSTRPTTKARLVLAGLFRIGWRLKRQSGSHRTLARENRPDYVFAFMTTRKSVHGCSRGSLAELD